MNVYKVYNLPIVQPMLQNDFQYSLRGEYLALFSDGHHATTSSGHNILTCLFIKGHISIRYCLISHCEN